ncbi:MAG: hypothetical protein LVO36_03495 [Nitrosopumilus sp. (ex Thoosa mismalolli)]|nr:hypothetical protein [Nitrosopumilus sp. (ex Thoosa mismalolli)]
MDEEINPIKDYLFEYINNSKTIPQLISEKKFDVIIDDVIDNCYDEIISMAQKDEAVGVLATGLLHYLLTNSLISSQRKLEYQGQELDIVIPDIQTLEKDAKKSLIICIPKSSNQKVINKKLAELEKIQPEKANIWLVLSENMETDRQSFVLEKQNNTFSKIIFEIAQFSNVGGANKFKILKI